MNITAKTVDHYGTHYIPGDVADVTRNSVTFTATNHFHI